MLLLIQVMAFSYILIRVDTQILNDSNELQIVNATYSFFGYTENKTALHTDKLHVNHNRSNITISTTTGVLDIDAPVETQSNTVSALYYKIKRTMYNYITSESSAESDIEFDMRRREDAYKKTDPKQNPYAVGLICEFGKVEQSCSGSLISEYWVLTAGHCVELNGRIVNGKIYVYAGGNSLREIKDWLLSNKPIPPTAQLIVSTEFYSDGQGLDIALIKLPTKFNLTDTVNIIKLSKVPWSYHGYWNCITTAFGTVSSDQPNDDDYKRKTQDLEVKQPCLCSFWLTLVSDATFVDFLCAKPVQDYGVCFGDSGGGLICDGQLVAVNMMIIGFEDVRYCEFDIVGMFVKALLRLKLVKCGGKNTLSVFQATYRSLSWVNSYVKLFSDKEIAESMALNSDGSLALSEFWFILVIISINLQFY